MLFMLYRVLFYIDTTYHMLGGGLNCTLTMTVVDRSSELLSKICDEYLKYSFYLYTLVSFSSVFMLNKFPNTLKVHTYDQVIHLVELCKISGKTVTKAATIF